MNKTDVDLVKEELDGIYDEEGLNELIGHLPKNIWYDVSFKLKITVKDGVRVNIVDGLDIRPTKEEVSDEKWIEGYKQWEINSGKK